MMSDPPILWTTLVVIWVLSVLVILMELVRLRRSTRRILGAGRGAGPAARRTRYGVRGGSQSPRERLAVVLLSLALVAAVLASLQSVPAAWRGFLVVFALQLIVEALGIDLPSLRQHEG